MPAPEIEALVLDGVRQHLASDGADPAMTDRDLIERHVERVTIKSQAVEVRFVSPSAVVQTDSHGPAQTKEQQRTITLPWAAPSFAAVKGIVHAPSAKPAIRARRL